MAAAPPRRPGGQHVYGELPEDALLEILRGKPIRSAGFKAQTAAQNLYNGVSMVVGGMVTNAGAAHDELTINSNPDGGGGSVGVLGLLANSGFVWGPVDDGVLCLGGLSVTQLVGTISGSLWIKRL